MKAANIGYQDAITTFQGKQGIVATGKTMISYGMKAEGGKKLPIITNAQELADPDDVKDLPFIPTEEE